MTQAFNIVRSSATNLNFDIVDTAADVDRSIVESSKNIEYFDSDYEDSFEKDFFIVIFDKHIFYRDVFIFIDRLKNLKKNFSRFKIKKYIVDCLKNTALKWQSTELNSLKRNLLRDVIVDQWCEALIQRFKKRDASVLKKLQDSFYIFFDVRSDKTPRAYIQNILRHAKAVDYSFIYHQLFNAWNDLNLKFRMQISEFIFDIQLNTFFDTLNSKITIWMKMTVKRFDSKNNIDFNNVVKSNRSISKQNRERFDDFFQQSDVNDFFFFKYLFSSNYISYQFQNSVYKNQRYQYQSFDEKRQQFFFFASFATLNSRQSLQITFENAFDSKLQNQTSRQQQKRSANVEKFVNNRNKKRTYVVDEVDEKQFNQNTSINEKNQSEYYISQQNLEYYNSQYQKYEKDESIDFFAIFLNAFKCRHCQCIFIFNNRLHEHVRRRACLQQSTTAALKRSFKSFNLKQFFLSTENRKTFTDAFVVESFSTEIIKKFESAIKLLIIYFFVDFKSDIDIDYEYRDWNYVKAAIAFFENVNSKMCCLNTDADVTLINKKFLKAQASDNQIKIMIISLNVRELNINRHFTVEYVIVFIYFVDTNAVDKKMKICFRRETHIVDDLKINMLIDNDIIDSKIFIIDLNNKTARINSCDVTVSIEIRSSKSSIVQLFVHLKKIIVVSAHIELTIFIHRMKNILSATRDFLFESKIINQLFMYAHLIDAVIEAIIVRNDNDVSMQISRNMRLNKIFELKYFNVFFADNENEQKNDEIRQLTIRRLVSEHK